MELFLALVNGFQLLTNGTYNSISDAAKTLDAPLGTVTPIKKLQFFNCYDMKTNSKVLPYHVRAKDFADFSNNILQSTGWYIYFTCSKKDSSRLLSLVLVSHISLNCRSVSGWHRSNRPEMYLGNGVLKICSRFYRWTSMPKCECKVTLLKSHFGMGVLL